MLDSKGIMVQFRVRARDFSQARPASYLNGDENAYCRGKMAGV